MTSERGFHTLDALRGVAASAVVLRHLQSNIVARYLPGSYLAVDLFFVLSGFVLAFSYEARLVTGSIKFRDFFTRRAIRLLPLHVVGTLIGAAVLLTVAMKAGPITTYLPGFLGYTLLAMIFMPTPAPFGAASNWLFPFNLPAWSLFWEMVIGAAFALIAPRLSNRMLGVLVIGSALLLTLAAKVMHSVDVGMRASDFVGGLPRVSYSFFAGVAIYRIWAARRLQIVLPAWTFPPIILCLFAISPSGIVGSIYELIAVFLLFPLVVWLASQAEPNEMWRKPFLIAGVTSYAMYVIHYPLLMLLVNVLNVKLDQIGDSGAIAFLVFVVALAFVLDRAFDLPVRREIQKTLRSKRSSADAAKAPS